MRHDSTNDTDITPKTKSDSGPDDDIPPTSSTNCSIVHVHIKTEIATWAIFSHDTCTHSSTSQPIDRLVLNNFITLFLPFYIPFHHSLSLVISSAGLLLLLIMVLHITEVLLFWPNVMCDDIIMLFCIMCIVQTTVCICKLSNPKSYFNMYSTNELSSTMVLVLTWCSSGSTLRSTDCFDPLLLVYDPNCGELYSKVLTLQQISYVIK